MPVSEAQKGTRTMNDSLTRQVTLNGLSDLMFDRYAGDNDTALAIEEKLYYADDGKTLVLPVQNLFSFLAAENTQSCAKRFCGKKWKGVAAAVKSCLVILPDPIPILDGKFTGFNEKVQIRHDVARLKNGVPNPKERPFIRRPWQLRFEIELFENEYLKETTLRQHFEKGGLLIGLGTYRPQFGRFEVAKWE